MKETIALFLLIIVMPFGILLAQDDEPCPCCTSEHRQFDFWLGSWVVFDTLGNEVGINNIVLLQDSCLIQENWTGSGGGTGTSYNYYNSTDHSWNQLWIDNSGSVLEMKGRYEKGMMILESQYQKGMNMLMFKNRISWEEMPDGSIVQTWDALNECGKLQRRLFKGIYRKQ